MAGVTVGLVLSCCRDSFSIGCCRALEKIRFRSVLFPRKCHKFVKNRCKRIDRRLRCGVCTTRCARMRQGRPRDSWIGEAERAPCQSRRAFLKVLNFIEMYGSQDSAVGRIKRRHCTYATIRAACDIFLFASRFTLRIQIWKREFIPTSFVEVRRLEASGQIPRGQERRHPTLPRIESHRATTSRCCSLAVIGLPGLS